MRAGDIKFRERWHLALSDSYITVYASQNCEPMVVWQSTVRRDGNSGGIKGGRSSNTFTVKGERKTPGQIRRMCENGEIRQTEEQ